MEKSIFECPICLETPSLPVATQCGHIFCWKCIKSWTYGQTMLVCPVCKNGLDMNKVISLYTSSSQFNAEKDERPKTDRIDPVRNQEGPSFFREIINGLGGYGTAEGDRSIVLPNENDVKVNRISLIIFLMGFFMIWVALRENN